jgi:tetratricopeptide (TPR) repeat protein
VSKEVDKIIADVVARAPRGKQCDALCAKGDELFGAEDLDGALKCFDRAVQTDTRSARAWTGRARILARKNRHGESLGCIDRALDAQPGFGPAVILKADALAKLGQRDEALRCYDAALAADSRAAGLWVRRGRLLEELKRFEDALASYSRAIEVEESADVWILRADVLTEQGKLDEVAKCFERAVAADPEHLDGWYRLARTKLKLRDGGGAKDALERFLALAPTSDGRVSSAQKMLADLVRPPPAAAPEPARTDVQSPPSARAEPARAERSAPPEPSAVLERNTPPEPSEQPQPSAQPEPSEPEPSAPLEPSAKPAQDDGASASGPRLDEVNALLADGRDIDALRALGPLLTEFPNATDAWFARARILIGMGQLEVAITSLERVTRLDRRNRAAWRLMASCWGDLKRPDRGLELADKTVSLDPDDPETHRLRARFLLDLKREKEARLALTTTLELADKCRATSLANEARALLAKL